MTDPVDINRVPKLNLGLQETDEVFITRQGSGPYRVPASSFPWEQKGDKGDPGGSWAPVLALVTDGVRLVHRVVDWVGGTGEKPTALGYVGATGFVATAAAAVDVRGAQGAAGWAPVLAVVEDGVRRVHQVVDWTGGAGTKPTTLGYVGATGIVETAAAAVDVRGPLGAVSAESMLEALSVAPVPVLQEISGLISGYIGNQIVLVNGDSIGNDGWLTPTSPPVLYSGGIYTTGVAVSGNIEARTEDQGYSAWVSARRGIEILNRAVAGNKLQDIIDRLASDVGIYGNRLGVVIDNGVTNSLFGPEADAMTEDALVASLISQKTTCIEYYRGLGAKVVIPECIPRSGFTNRQNRVAARYNRWLNTLPWLQPWIRVAPVAALMSNPDVYGSATPAPRWSRDGTHTNNVGAHRYSGAVNYCLDGWVPRNSRFRPSLMEISAGFGSHAIVRNSNPTIGLGSGGSLGEGFVGQIAAQYSVKRLVGVPTGACSIVVDDDGYNRQRLVIDFTAVGQAVSFGISPASGLWDSTRSGLLSCVADATVSGDQIVNRLLMFTQANVGGVNYKTTALNQNLQSIAAAGNLQLAQGEEVFFLAPRIYVPQGACASWETQVRIYASAAGPGPFTAPADLRQTATRWLKAEGARRRCHG
jgi:hypothetical protein